MTKQIIALVDDDRNILTSVAMALEAEGFEVKTYGDGEEALRGLTAKPPALAVLDIKMPRMDGMELLSRLRQTSSIPVIFLTSKDDELDELLGLRMGADDYITKPFNFELLLSRIKNNISQQSSLRKTFQQHIEANPSEIAISSADEQFVKQALEIVEKNISNPDFSVEELSRALFMSRVSVYKKILSLTGRSPIEFIRNIRLKRAARLLEKSQLTVAEVAYEVGFNNPKYFTKYFKMEYNVLPSLYKAESLKHKA